MSATRALVVGAAMALVAAGCGGDGDKAATTTSSPPTSEETTTTLPATTTTTALGPELEKLLLVEADLPNFEEQAEGPAEADDDDDITEICDATETPALTALEGEPEATGKTFERGSGIPVEVSSFAGKTTPEKAEAAMDELLDPKVRKCLEDDFRAEVGQDLPAGVTATVNVTSTETKLTGLDQVVVLSAIASVRGAGGTQSFRFDLVFLRLGGTIVIVSYGGGGGASVAERQRIVSTAARKLRGTTTSGTSTTRATGGTGSTSSTSRSSTTRRSTTTTRQGSTTSTTR